MRAVCTAWQSRTVAAAAATHSGRTGAPHGFDPPSEPDARWVEKTSSGPTGWSMRAYSTLRKLTWSMRSSVAIAG